MNIGKKCLYLLFSLKVTSKKLVIDNIKRRDCFLSYLQGETKGRQISILKRVETLTTSSSSYNYGYLQT
ncbi:hypothetical protein Mapa_000835 [Marchantia paleacea]|nr:hypothetical protein Mapa_000835 [Marchantia paleacea]